MRSLIPTLSLKGVAVSSMQPLRHLGADPYVFPKQVYRVLHTVVHVGFELLSPLL